MEPDALNLRRYERQRRQLIETMQERGIEDLAVLRAFDLVPRHLFLPEAVQHRAYEDAPLPIGYGQTASQPSLQALYMQTLKLQPHERVLEVGTGTGFQTAVLAQLVQTRWRELGLRMALGAQRSQVRWMVVRHGGRLLAAGTVIGLVAAAGATRVLASLLFEVRPLDAPTYVGVAIVVAVAGIIAAWIPAMRASTANPAVSLRAE